MKAFMYENVCRDVLRQKSVRRNDRLSVLKACVVFGRRHYASHFMQSNISERMMYFYNALCCFPWGNSTATPQIQCVEYCSYFQCCLSLSFSPSRSVYLRLHPCLFFVQKMIPNKSKLFEVDCLETLPPLETNDH